MLVWDDGSSDATREQLRRLCRTHPEMQLHEGPSARTPAVGRNRLIELARGDWVAMLDDDDEWLPDKLERQQPYMGTWDVIASGATRRSEAKSTCPTSAP